MKIIYIFTFSDIARYCPSFLFEIIIIYNNQPTLSYNIHAKPSQRAVIYYQRRKPPTISVRLDFLNCVQIFIFFKKEICEESVSRFSLQ